MKSIISFNHWVGTKNIASGVEVSPTLTVSDGHVPAIVTNNLPILLETKT